MRFQSPFGESVQRLLSGTARGELPLRVVYGTSFADGCIRVQRGNSQVHVEAKNLIVRKEATRFQTVCTTMTPDTVKPFSGNATGKLFFGVTRCDNVLYCFWVFSSGFLGLALCGWSGVWLPGPRFGGPALVCSGFPWVPRWSVGRPSELNPTSEGCACRGLSLRWGRLLVLLGVGAKQIGDCRQPVRYT